jgi:chromosome segregation ATPase
VNDRDPFSGTLEFDAEAWHRAGCPTLESLFVRWQAAETRANAAEAELRETAGELATAEDDRDQMTAQLTAEMRAHAETRAKLERLKANTLELQGLVGLTTKAERAVLDDMTNLPKALLEVWRVHGSIPVSNVAVSELARRGEKP